MNTDHQPDKLSEDVLNTRAGKPDPGSALRMLAAFESVGATSFDVTLLDIDGRENGFQSRRSLQELRRSIAWRLNTATAARQSLVIRPRSATALLIQLDDFSPERAAALERYAFMTLYTSPGNCQIWLAVSDGPNENDREAAKRFRTRIRRGTGADHSATGAVRIAGSLNFKAKYAPAFPLIILGHVKPGERITTDALNQAGLIARDEPQQAAASVPRELAPARSRASRWPDYQQALRGAPRKEDGTPDRSLADFMFCKWAAERGHSIEAVANKLVEVSLKAQERIAVKDDAGYPILTARNAAAAVERRRETGSSVSAQTLTGAGNAGFG